MNSDVKKIFEPRYLAKPAAGEELLNWKMKTSKVGPDRRLYQPVSRLRDVTGERSDHLTFPYINPNQLENHKWV